MQGMGVEQHSSAIVNNADMVVAFWNGTSKGTKYTIDYANRKGVATLIVTI